MYDDDVSWYQQQNDDERRHYEENVMGRHSKDSGTFEQAPEGTHVARCFQIIDIGTQHGSWDNKEIIRNQIIVSWELPTELNEEGKPFIVSNFYTNSLGKKATLHAHLVNWRGRPFTSEELDGFDLETIVGAPGMISIIHNDKDKAKVTSITKLPKGFECPPAVNAKNTFWLEPWDQAKFENISDGLKKLIMKSDEYLAMVGGKPKTATTTTRPAGDFDDLEEPPF